MENNQAQPPSAPSQASPDDGNLNTANPLTLTTRSIFGGVLMGLANLVPGISGGTMLLAAGIYPDFIKSLSDVTRFRFNWRSLLVLGCIVLAAGIGILLLAGTLKDLVVEKRWIMYSLFIGLTLGGVPIVWRLVERISRGLVMGVVAAFLVMVGLEVLKYQGVVGTGGGGFVGLLVAGLAGASAMILPGLSGGYLLLLLGQYVPILNGIDQFKDALSARDVSAAMEPALSVVLPVGIGVLIGVVAVGNLLQWLLRKHQNVTLGILLGLLIGSVVGLYPFRVGVAPQVGDTFKSRIVTAEMLEEIEPEDYPNQPFPPNTMQVLTSVGLVVAGFLITLGVARIGRDANQSVT